MPAPEWGPFTTVKVLLRAWTAAAAAATARGPTCLRGSEENAMVADVVMRSLVDCILSRRPWPGRWTDLAADVWRQASLFWEVAATAVAGLAQMLDIDAHVGGSGGGGGGPPGVVAALAGGALPFLEWLLRRTVSEVVNVPKVGHAAVAERLLRDLEQLLQRAGPEIAKAPKVGHAAVAERLLRDLTRDGEALGPARTLMSLLAYGDGLQAAAFVALVTKHLRRALRLGARTFRGIALRLATSVLDAAVNPAVFNGAGVPAQRAETLGLVLSVAVGEWLPMLSSLLQQNVVMFAALASLHIQVGWSSCFRKVMDSAACAGVLSSSCSDDGWRRDAITQAGLVPLVGAAMQVLRVLERRPSRGEDERFVADSAARLACTAPDEVLRAHGDFAWRPEAVRVLAQTSESFGPRAGPIILCLLAAHLEAGSPAFESTLPQLQPSTKPASLLQTLSPLLVPPAEARRRLGLPPACASPACVNLAGESEVVLKRQKCGGCGRVEYCCKECQWEDWKAGHKAACGGP
ncbi:hypothetical protein HYH03_011055 [Edaphochlamys debaryana]|uniref:phytol kinase n=1 Tax=Edaphochlamys debaryana TaxID=47281 RepID=A0A836BWS4_9CHLO|nr:hypothetical protein HYH03_011055 [Edaphochlamys debaryana]|eukprot:KAG2490419.1 hypothetical protein HYH03_011055 [Edaphochlamys debaryana]